LSLSLRIALAIGLDRFSWLCWLSQQALNLVYASAYARTASARARNRAAEHTHRCCCILFSDGLPPSFGRLLCRGGAAMLALVYLWDLIHAKLVNPQMYHQNRYYIEWWQSKNNSETMSRVVLGSHGNSSTTRELDGDGWHCAISTIEVRTGCPARCYL
jgi:hypothetical protein